jgi:hypothetical protein
MAMPVWIREKLFLKRIIKDHLKSIAGTDDIPSILFPEHHFEIKIKYSLRKYFGQSAEIKW